MIGNAIRTIARTEPAIVARLAQAGVASVHEAQDRTGLAAPVLRPAWPGARAAGPAVTALCAPGDNTMIHVAIELMQPGDLLVVATTSCSLDGYFGDILAEAVRARGGVGAVLDTGIRDVRALREARFPAWSRAVSAQGTVKRTLGSANYPVVLAGVVVHPGDAVICDDDGIVVVPRLKTVEVLAAAEARIVSENDLRDRLREGASTLDLLGLRQRLADAGLRYHDGPREQTMGGANGAHSDP